MYSYIAFRQSHVNL